MNNKLIRITTIPMALKYLLPGQMQFMRQNGFDVIMISADGKELEEVIQQEQCKHIKVPMTRRITPLKDLLCLIQLIKIFKKEKPDIVHSHTPKAGLLGMLAARFCGVKVRIHTVAGLPLMVEKGFKYQVLKFVEKLTYASATQVWPNSNSLLHFIESHKLTSRQKLMIIGKGSSNGINIERFNKDKLDDAILAQIKLSISYEPGTTYLLCIGRLVADKGIPELVEVFNTLSSKDPALKLILVGDYEKELDPIPAKTIKEIESNPSIIHIGWTPHVEYYMDLAGIFIFPSHREGFPNVLLQAGAMGLPIICSKIEGNIDIVTHLQTGLLFEKGDAGMLLQQINFAIENKTAMLKMAAELQEIVKKDYRRENIWQNILTQYNSLLHLDK